MTAAWIVFTRRQSAKSKRKKNKIVKEEVSLDGRLKINYKINI